MHLSSVASFLNDGNSIKLELGMIFKYLMFCTIPWVQWLFIPSECPIVLLYEGNINASSTQEYVVYEVKSKSNAYIFIVTVQELLLQPR